VAALQGEQQFVVGGFEVAEKKSVGRLRRFPELSPAETRTERASDGRNVIVDSRGNHHKLDDHKNLGRIEKYIVGSNTLVTTRTQQSFKAARKEL